MTDTEREAIWQDGFDAATKHIPKIPPSFTGADAGLKKDIWRNGYDHWKETRHG